MGGGAEAPDIIANESLEGRKNYINGGVLGKTNTNLATVNYDVCSVVGVVERLQ